MTKEIEAFVDICQYMDEYCDTHTQEEQRIVEKALYTLEIIDKKNVDIEFLKDACYVEYYNNAVIYKHRQLAQREFDLLKEVFK